MGVSKQGSLEGMEGEQILLCKSVTLIKKNQLMEINERAFLVLHGSPSFRDSLNQVMGYLQSLLHVPPSLPLQCLLALQCRICALSPSSSISFHRIALSRNYHTHPPTINPGTYHHVRAREHFLIRMSPLPHLVRLVLFSACLWRTGVAIECVLTSPYIFPFFLFCFIAAPAAYGGSQTRDQIRAVAAGLHHSHGNVGSELHLLPIWQLWKCQIFNPLSETRDQACILMDTVLGS